MNARRLRGFTLIELLVVIGLIAVLSGGLAMALRDGNKSQALQGGQSTLNSLLSAARAQAVLKQQKVAILIWADKTKHDTFLRHAAVAGEVTSGNWEIYGDGFDLPQSIFFVPPDANATGSNGAKLATSSDWTGTNNLLTDSEGSALRTDNIKAWDQGTNMYVTVDSIKIYEACSFNALGQLTNQSVNQFVISVGERESESVIRFDSPDRVRGLFVSRYGIPFYINEKLGFKN